MATKDYAAELQAMASIMDALAPLDRDAQVSVLQWVLDKLQLPLLPSGGGERATPVKEPEGESGSGRSQSTQMRPGTINTVASRLGADSCRTVIISAALHLTLFQGKDSFSRSELVGLARTAKVWKSDYTNQTSTTISRLADAGVLVEKGKDTYFLSDAAIDSYRAVVE